MSIKQLVPLNLLALATAPTGVRAGELYFNTTDDTVYVYTGTEWVTTSRANGFTTVDDTTPADPVNGDFWFDTTTNSLLLWSTDTWVTVSGSSGNVNNPVDLSSSWWLGA